ncbi:PepSY domain-containing protein [Terrilactibacillus laevilacticus]|uniref:PepSY domain-containing protein n=1 Tax=Terrilactibacillus laevilacticus TaxID=1380157 RepID=UPI001146EAE7|nr:PepSY domain-containing protein [Terrilactibacillus laevilacticus]
MKWKPLIFGFVVGMTSQLVYQKRKEKQLLTPEKALQSVKKSVKSDLDVNNGWIYLTPTDMKRHGISYNVYQGGVTANQGNEKKHYDFIVDAQTGTILELQSH